MIAWWAFQFGVGIIYSQMLEWFLHNKLLHGVGVQKGKPFSFHFHTHHRIARQNEGIDPMYAHSPWRKEGPSNEVKSLILLSIPHLILFPFVPFFVFGNIVGAIRYYHIHRKSHTDLDWAKKHVPWHYDHHMGPNQHANWGVTGCWMDILMGTRVPYFGTERYYKDEEKRRVRRERIRHKAEIRSARLLANSPDNHQPASDAL